MAKGGVPTHEEVAASVARNAAYIENITAKLSIMGGEIEP
jgi:hypothetical protein